ncbi:MAG: hypothetical protein IJD67_00305, partial [Clostridia bacterium]|nr:hypothetical protein [Clostridia bacterium]
MKRTRLTRLIAAILSLLMLVTCFSFTAVADETEQPAEKVMSYDIEEVKALLNALTYTEYSARNARIPKATSTVVVNAVDYDAELTDAAVEVVNDYNGEDGEALFFPSDGSVTWKINFEKTGKYAVSLYYTSTGNQKSTSIERACLVDGEYPFKGLSY